MKHSTIFSRRVKAAVDFSPDMEPCSPFAQMRRLEVHLRSNVATPETITDCPTALDYLREYTYRKVFTGTSHEDFVRTDTESPDTVDWLLAIHELETGVHKNVTVPRSRR